VLLSASERLYGALLLLYPKGFRRRYASEMRRDFGDLSREGLEEGGGRELARVWAATLSDLAVTALKERSTMLARNAYLPVAPRIVVRLMVALVFIAVTVAVASLARTPQYEASAMLLVGHEQNTQQLEELQALAQTTAEATHSRVIAEDVIKRLGLSTTPEVLLERLDAEPVDNTQFIELSYTDPDPERAQRMANTIGDAVSQRVSEVSPSANAPTATLWHRASVPEEP